MTPELKAKELVEKYVKRVFSGNYMPTEWAIICAKACAIICCDEILEIAVWFNHDEKDPDEATYEYWQSVKKEINSL